MVKQWQLRPKDYQAKMEMGSGTGQNGRSSGKIRGRTTETEKYQRDK
jgi:hypothetical protein